MSEKAFKTIVQLSFEIDSTDEFQKEIALLQLKSKLSFSQIDGLFNVSKQEWNLRKVSHTAETNEDFNLEAVSDGEINFLSVDLYTKELEEYLKDK